MELLIGYGVLCLIVGLFSYFRIYRGCVTILRKEGIELIDGVNYPIIAFIVWILIQTICAPAVLYQILFNLDRFTQKTLRALIK